MTNIHSPVVLVVARTGGGSFYSHSRLIALFCEAGGPGEPSVADPRVAKPPRQA